MIETTGSLLASGVSRAYRAGQAMPAAPAATTEALGRPSFTDMLERTALETIETVRAGDRAAVAGLAGTLPTQQVVEATMAMESALQVTVAVRDRMVEAYQEILRMAV